VKAFTRGLCLAFVTLGVTGCGADNETEAEKLSKTMGDPGAPNPKAISTDITQGPPPTMQDVKRQAEENQKKTYSKASGYPGAKSN
jgi:hypothetical protein